MSKKERKIKIDKLGDEFHGRLIDMKWTCPNGAQGSGSNPAAFLLLNILAVCCECSYCPLPEEIVSFLLCLLIIVEQGLGTVRFLSAGNSFHLSFNLY